MSILKAQISQDTLLRWYHSLTGYHSSDVPDTVSTRREIAHILGILDEEDL